jgi:hypothetical protein
MNPLAGESDLLVYSDAARNPAKQAAVDEVRSYLKTITGFRSVTVKHRPENYGLAKSIIQGVTEVMAEKQRIIVLEDDMLTSPHFLTYMNEALDKYADDNRVVSIHGYAYPVNQLLPESFFLPGADCWGWGTWRRGWKHFNPDGRYLFDSLRRRKLMRTFDFNGAYPFSEMLEDQIDGRNDSWAIRWYASALLADKLTLYPGRSLVCNIGHDGSGTHCGTTTIMDTVLSATPISLANIAVEPSLEGWQAFARFLRQGQSGPQRLVRRILSPDQLRSIRALARDWTPPAMSRWIRSIVDGNKG